MMPKAYNDMISTAFMIMDQVVYLLRYSVLIIEETNWLAASQMSITRRPIHKAGDKCITN